MAALQRNQLNQLCSTSETFEKAHSILRLANAKTRPGSGFVVKSTVAIPAVCAYLASEQLNTGEVSLQSAMSAACVTQVEFADILKKVRAALRTEEGNVVIDVTYKTLVDAYHIHPREEAIACMEDAEAALPRVDILKERYGANILLCAVFYWVCQLMEEPSVQERSLRQSYSIHPKTFKAVVAILDKQCDGIADQIKFCLLQKRSSAQASTSSQPNRVSKPIPTSPVKSPMKSAMRLRTTTRKISTPATTPSKKRIVAFSQGGDSTFPETPTKKRRVDTSSPANTKLKTQADSQLSPSHSQGTTSPIRPAVRHRFRPVFLEQQQWCARDPKVERMWAAVETRRNEMEEDQVD